MPQMTLVFARLVMSNESDIDSDEEVPTFAKMYVRSVEVIEVRKRLAV